MWWIFTVISGKLQFTTLTKFIEDCLSDTWILNEFICILSVFIATVSYLLEAQSPNNKKFN